MYGSFYCGRDESIYSVLELSIKIHVLPLRKMGVVPSSVSGRVQWLDFNQGSTSISDYRWTTRNTLEKKFDKPSTSSRQFEKIRNVGKEGENHVGSF